MVVKDNAPVTRAPVTGGIGRPICFALHRAARERGQRLALAAAASRPGDALDSRAAD